MYLYDLETKVTCRKVWLFIYDPTLQEREMYIWTCSTPAQKQICCHCYSKGCQPVGKSREAPSHTLDANRKDLSICKVSRISHIQKAFSMWLRRLMSYISNM
jgi:hypothetical protein